MLLFALWIICNIWCKQCDFKILNKIDTCGTNLLKKIRNMGQFQITLLKGDDFLLNNGVQNFINILVSSYPCLNLDFRTLKMEKFGHLKTVTNPRQKTTYVIFEPSISDHLLENMVNLSPDQPRPHTLMFLQNQPAPSEEILSKAWAMKFLDFTIFDSIRCRLTYYDPFGKILRNSDLSEDSIIFPNKLKNMRNYSLKVPVLEMSPYMTSTNATNPLTYSGIHYTTLRLLAEALNFRLDFLVYPYLMWRNKSWINPSLDDSIVDLKNDDIDMTSIAFPSIYTITNYTAVWGMRHYGFEFCGVVSIKTTHFYEIPLGMVGNLLLNTGIVCLSLSLIKRYRITRQELDLLRVVKVLFSASGTKEPSSPIDKIIFFLLTVFSMSVFSGFQTTLTSMMVYSNHLRLASYADIAKYNFIIYVHAGLQAGIEADINENLDNGTKVPELVAIKDIEECGEKLLKGEKAICLTPMDRAKIFIQR